MACSGRAGSGPLAIGIAVVLAVAGCWSNTKSAYPKDFTDDHDGEDRFAMKHPSDWRNGSFYDYDKSEYPMLFTADMGTDRVEEVASVGVSVRPVSGTAIGSEALKAELAAYADLVRGKGQTIVATASALLDQEPAQHLVTDLGAGGDARSRQTIGVRGAFVYRVAFMAATRQQFDRWLPTADAMVASFRFLK